jgi:hypothetical protein
MMPEVAANGQFSSPIDILVPFSSPKETGPIRTSLISSSGRR